MQTPTPPIQERAATEEGYWQIFQILIDAGESWQDALWLVDDLAQQGYEIIAKQTEERE